jgi:competence protein ComEA
LKNKKGRRSPAFFLKYVNSFRKLIREIEYIMENKITPTWTTILTILGTMLFTSFLFFITKPQQGHAVQLLPAPIKKEIVFDIFGAVANPGVYSLPPESRVFEAIEAAGGLLPDAYTGHLNQAAILVDEQKIEIPLLVKNENEYYTIGNIGDISSSSAGLININSAGINELIELPNIGETRATAIIDYRNENGPFSNIEDIINVSGIGSTTLDLVRDLVTIYSNP